MASSVYRKCPRCGQHIYRTKWDQHQRDCLTLVTRFGSPKELADAFCSQPDLQVGDLAKQARGVSKTVIANMLVQGGVPLEDLDMRYASSRLNHSRCASCSIILTARGVQPGKHDPSVCSWCEADRQRLGETAALVAVA